MAMLANERDSAIENPAKSLLRELDKAAVDVAEREARLCNEIKDVEQRFVHGTERLEARMDRQFEQVRSEQKESEARTSAQINSVKSSIRWAVGIIIAAVAALPYIHEFLLRLVGH